MVEERLSEDGYVIFGHDPDVAAWAVQAGNLGKQVLAQDGERRHGGTWFVGVDALPNAPDGRVNGVPLAGAWRAYVDAPSAWHRAQLSVVFPRYPQQDEGESDAAHRFRRNRDAAHVDGLLPEGPDKRRHLREPHSFILGFPLNEASASPLVVWQGSHRIMQAAFGRAFAGLPPAAWGDVDVTDIYKAARQDVFATCARVEIRAAPGQAVLLHRHLLHGVAPWADEATEPMRMMAYFRPLVDTAAWLSPFCRL